jgi:pyruvate/2-oxoglutarate dehydrogenase complex dihydrolipoamide dehydrogenase (E3) component
VWHSYFQPLEMTLSNRMNDEKTQCYAKLITHKKDKDRVLGFHILSPNAGEITQGVGVAIK